MTTIKELIGSRMVGAGQKAPGEVLDIPTGRHALWLIDGEAEWLAESAAPATVEPGEAVHKLTGPGTLQFLKGSHYAWFETWDELGFGPRAVLYRTLMESRNRGVGQALATGLPLGPNQIWVDIGTGTGAMVQALQEQAKGQGSIWILGIDRASRMIEEAWRHPSGDSPAWFVAQDLLSVNWPEDTFDGITALLFLHLVDDIDRLVGEIYRALKPGGLFAYAVSSDANPFVRMIMHQLARPGDFFKRGRRAILQSVVNAGFEVVRSESYRDEIILDNSEAMRELIGSIGGPASRGVRADITPPRSIERIFDLVWAQRPRIPEKVVTASIIAPKAL